MPENPQQAIQSSPILPGSASIQQAINTMAEDKASCVLIVENQKLLGIFTEQDVVRMTTSRNSSCGLTLTDGMTANLITLKTAEMQDIFSVSSIFTKHRIRHIPILDDEDKVVGVVTPESIRTLLKPEYLLRYLRVEEVMSKKVIHGFPEDSILCISQKMADFRVSCAVILDPSSLFPIGIITERDIVRFHHLRLDMVLTSAQSVMTAPLVTMLPQDSLWSVHQRMQQMGIRRLVVAKQSGELAGIVTQTQMLRMLDPVEMYHVMQQMQEIIDCQTSELNKLNQELKTANLELSRLSTVDELTQIVNRRQLTHFLNREWERLMHLGKPLSAIMCDVDNFKAYNDTYGHLAGDKCLIKVAQTLRKSTRQSTDLVARYGGEEFAIVLPNTDLKGAERVAKSIIAEVQKLQIPHISSSTTGYITLSLGVATLIPSSHTSPTMLLEIADRLLYQSKDRGRNNYQCQLVGGQCPP